MSDRICPFRIYSPNFLTSGKSTAEVVSDIDSTLTRGIQQSRRPCFRPYMYSKQRGRLNVWLCSALPSAVRLSAAENELLLGLLQTSITGVQLHIWVTPVSSIILLLSCTLPCFFFTSLLPVLRQAPAGRLGQKFSEEKNASVGASDSRSLWPRARGRCLRR